MSEMWGAFTDRNGRLIKPGHHVRIQVCTGRYGQTAIRQGTVTKLSNWGGFMIKTDKDFTEDCGRFGVQLRKAGSEVYVTVPRGGYQKFEDFEHGHETWVEVIEQ